MFETFFGTLVIVLLGCVRSKREQFSTAPRGVSADRSGTGIHRVPSPISSFHVSSRLGFALRRLSDRMGTTASVDLHFG
jgi:hypothetical protein